MAAAMKMGGFRIDDLLEKKLQDEEIQEIEGTEEEKEGEGEEEAKDEENEDEEEEENDEDEEMESESEASGEQASNSEDKTLSIWQDLNRNTESIDTSSFCPQKRAKFTRHRSRILVDPLAPESPVFGCGKPARGPKLSPHLQQDAREPRAHDQFPNADARSASSGQLHVGLPIRRPTNAAQSISRLAALALQPTAAADAPFGLRRTFQAAASDGSSCRSFALPTDDFFGANSTRFDAEQVECEEISM
ncbi:hypothetical protein L596_019285 [Steinernema carpocapsae]|uniref:Uncharacterized protein n=1 Tax=Steinernema carpocapsae TaxID=34508 RepID=A0A4U5MPZ4_STECR|nr:hypothetical protein L596_019285 [Steinernema carpocapsae]